MVNEYIFFRLCRKPARGPGRRYYRLLSYPQDRRMMQNNGEAVDWASSHRYAAVLAPGHQWMTFNDAAAQCVRWHNDGRKGYVQAS